MVDSKRFRIRHESNKIRLVRKVSTRRKEGRKKGGGGGGPIRNYLSFESKLDVNSFHRREECVYPYTKFRRRENLIDTYVETAPDRGRGAKIPPIAKNRADIFPVCSPTGFPLLPRANTYTVEVENTHIRDRYVNRKNISLVRWMEGIRKIVDSRRVRDFRPGSSLNSLLKGTLCAHRLINSLSSREGNEGREKGKLIRIIWKGDRGFCWSFQHYPRNYDGVVYWNVSTS